MARRRRRQPDRQRALAMLAGCPDGCPEATMVAHGFTLEDMVALVRAGLATATPERVRAGRKMMEVRITDAGRFVFCGKRHALAPAPSGASHHH